ncbi:hypothetical protein CHU98_g12372, partial [Xylaria longipes]
MPSTSRKAKKGGDAYIMEDEDEPLDLLDRNALASISSTKPGKLRKAGKTKMKTDMDGKLIVGEDSDDADDDAMVVDTPADEGGGGVGAYVAALKGKDAGRRGRGGRLKFSNKRGQTDDEDEEMDVSEKEVSTIKSHVNRGRGGGHFRGGRGGGGPRGGRSGRGGIASGRRGLGEDKRRGPAGGFGGGKVWKPKSPGRSPVYQRQKLALSRRHYLSEACRFHQIQSAIYYTAGTVWVYQARLPSLPELGKDDGQDEYDQHRDDGDGDYPICSHPNPGEET